MNNHQLNNLSVYYSGDDGTYHLALAGTTSAAMVKSLGSTYRST